MTYRKAELKAFAALGVEDKLAEDELQLLGSVLEFSGKTVGSIMVSRPERSSQCLTCSPQTSMSDTYKLPSDRVVNMDLIEEVRTQLTFKVVG